MSIGGISSVANAGIYLLITILFAVAIRLFNDPLRHIPGPLIARWTPIWLWYISWRGDECSVLDQLHQQYEPVIRIAPNQIDISDGRALSPIKLDY
ncbi:hypothetical protein F4808DRAFT_437455 [Astrocystis sublimbata]|nr:hypothetical protein F4808DRAFT_437455 [Astrocystis sublimbata]